VVRDTLSKAYAVRDTLSKAYAVRDEVPTFVGMTGALLRWVERDGPRFRGGDSEKLASG